MPPLTAQLASHPILAQEVDDPGRSYWFIALLIIFAIQHLAEKIKQRREIQDEEELQRRSLEIDEELLDEEPGGYHDPSPNGETLAEFFRSLTRQDQAEPTPPVQPPIPPPRQRVSPSPKPPPPAERPAPSLSAAEQRALAALKKAGPHNKLLHGRTRRQRMHSSSSHTALGNMLRSPENLRNAFILKEILEPPVSARETSEPHRC